MSSRVIGLVAAALAAASLAVAPAAASATGAPSTPAPTSPASVGASSSSSSSVTFGIEPASATSIDGRPAIQIGATPGASANDHVALVNYSTKPIELTLFATDALNTDQGGLTGLLATQKPTDVGAWIHVPGAGRLVTVPARSVKGPGTVIFPLTITVPEKATPGDHAGLLFAVLSTTTNQQNAANVQLDQRVGTRVFVRVTGALDARLKLSGLAASYRGTWNPVGTGTATLSFTVSNPGNVRLGGEARVTVAGAFGQTSPKQAPLVIPLLLPGNSVSVTQTVSGVYPQFGETASVTLTAIPVQGDTVPSVSGDAASVAFTAIPWPLIVVVGLLLLVLVVGIWMVLRRRTTRQSLGTRSIERSRVAEPVGRRERR